MKNLIFMIALCSVVFVGCDGRKSKSVALKESIQEFKDTIGPIEIIKYVPEDYAENLTDTILNNGYRIKIKTYTDMENGVVDSITINDTITTKIIKRDFKSIVSVFKDDKQIFTKTINKDLFSNQYDYHGDILKEMTLTTVWVNQTHQLDQDIAQIEVDYCKSQNTEEGLPPTYCLHYVLIINPDGSYIIRNVEY